MPGSGEASIALLAVAFALALGLGLSVEAEREVLLLRDYADARRDRGHGSHDARRDRGASWRRGLAIGCRRMLVQGMCAVSSLQLLLQIYSRAVNGCGHLSGLLHTNKHK